MQEKRQKIPQKSQGVMFVNDHKFADKKGLAVMIFKKTKEVKQCFKDLKKKGHPSPKMAGGSCELVKGENDPELKVELKLGGLKEDKIIAKGKSYLKSAIGLLPTIVAPDPKDSDGQVDVEEQEEVTKNDVQELKNQFELVKNQIKNLKPSITNLKSGEAGTKEVKLLQTAIYDIKHYLSLSKNMGIDVQQLFEKPTAQFSKQKKQLELLYEDSLSNGCVLRDEDNDCIESHFMMAIQLWAATAKLAIHEFRSALALKGTERIAYNVLADSILFGVSIVLPLALDMLKFITEELVKSLSSYKNNKDLIIINDLTTEWEQKFDAFKNNTVKHKELYKDWIQKKEGVDDLSLIKEIKSWTKGGKAGLPSAKQLSDALLTAWVNSSKDGWDWDSDAGMIEVWISYNTKQKEYYLKKGPKFDDLRKKKNTLELIKKRWKNTPILDMPFDIWIHIKYNTGEEITIKRLNGAWVNAFMKEVSFEMGQWILRGSIIPHLRSNILT